MTTTQSAFRERLKSKRESVTAEPTPPTLDSLLSRVESLKVRNLAVSTWASGVKPGKHYGMLFAERGRKHFHVNSDPQDTATLAIADAISKMLDEIGPTS